jgi:hypothetical protein
VNKNKLEEIKCGDYYEYYCENFIIFWWMILIINVCGKLP